MSEHDEPDNEEQLFQNYARNQLGIRLPAENDIYQEIKELMIVNIDQWWSVTVSG